MSKASGPFPLTHFHPSFSISLSHIFSNRNFIFFLYQQYTAAKGHLAKSEDRILNQHPVYRHSSLEATKDLTKRTKQDPLTEVTFEQIYISLMHKSVAQATVSPQLQQKASNKN
jgi:hypothetical protein